jgi:hypothetical protein
MLNKELATTARNKLNRAVDEHAAQIKYVTTLSTDLYERRRESSHELIPKVEAYVNSLTAKPKEFSRAFAAFDVERRTFDGLVEEVDSMLHDAVVTSTSGAGVGVAAGAATALMAPTAAMALATTFGTASTGTAIASLSGAAATNAALAWLGGGVVAAGGGGMAGGSALLALAGPIGWGLAGLAAVGGVTYSARANAKVAEEADAKRLPIEADIRALKQVALEIMKLLDLTKTQTDGMQALMKSLKRGAPDDYRKFTADQKSKAGALVNHVETLTQLLNMKVG